MYSVFADCKAFPHGPTPGDFFGYHGGPVITSVHVIPMFWGTWWDNSTNPSVIQVYAALASIVTGSYMSQLSQYKGIGAGQVLLESGARSNGSNPPNNFTDSNVQSLVAAAIDAGAVPSPTDLPGNPYLYTVFMPPGISPQNGAGGEHWSFSHNGVKTCTTLGSASAAGWTRLRQSSRTSQPKP